MRMLAVSAVIVLLSCLLVAAVDRRKFRTCGDTGFCKRYRNRASPAEAKDMFHVRAGSVVEKDGHFIAKIAAPNAADLTLELFFLVDGAVRMRISEDAPRWQPTDLLMPAGLVTRPYTKPSAADLPEAWRAADPRSYTACAVPADHPASDSDSSIVIVQHAPFKLIVYRNGLETVVVNDRQLLHFEQSSGTLAPVSDSTEEVADRHAGKQVQDYGEDGLAIYTDGSREQRAQAAVSTQAGTGESFAGHLDSMPRGARSVGIDISFPQADAVYGIPEHTSPLSLPSTTSGGRYAEPYRLYNLDVFEYELDNPMALYGHIPVMLAQGYAAGAAVAAGVFVFNPSELFVDVSDEPLGQGKGKYTHWMAESGLVDLFLLPGIGMKAAVAQYMSLTGGAAMVPIFSLGYHQSRWNYRDEKDVAAVNGMFEALDYPMDMLWLDIDYTDGRRYFTWDAHLFPHPLEMQQNLSAVGRRMVTIIDPHLKRDNHYPVHTAALRGDHYIKDKHGKVYDGWCWPGSSSYLDFTSAKVRAFWAEQFSLSSFKGSSLDLFTWNDMNEPSVFNGPEVSMPKDNLNLEGVEHREWHNLYGIYMQMATAQGLVQRTLPPVPSVLDSLWTNNRDKEQEVSANTRKQRPFVLTRSFWAGSQRYGAMWTGDNAATWEHLRVSLPMLLSINIAGLSFAGADVGGYFHNTDAELFVRWYQAGAFTPFFRGHAHQDTKRKEPWVYGEPFTSINRATAMLRYTLLPYWYTVMQEAFEAGLPALRPLFLEFPLPALSAVEDAFFVGDSVLVKPVTAAGAKQITVTFPLVQVAGKGMPWYELQTMRQVKGSDAGSQGVSEVTLPVQLSSIPAFLRPGSILARKMRLRRSSKLMFNDPYTLFIAPAGQTASGKLYMDDETSFAYEDGLFAHRLFTYADNLISCQALKTVVKPIGYSQVIAANPAFQAVNTVERIVLAGQKGKPTPKRVLLIGEQPHELLFSMSADGDALTIKKPNVLAAQDWQIKLEY